MRQNAFVTAADECPATTETNVDDSTGSDETEEVFLSNNKVKTVVNIGSDSNSSRRSGPRLRRTER